jgi:HEPN domain-containing protein
VPHTHELPKLWEEVAQAGLTPSLELAEAQFISKLQQLHRYGAENLELDELPVADAERAMDIARACSEATRLALPA